jgi:hypothetical protein
MAWVAGLIEGEGCIQLRAPARPHVSVSSTDKDVVLRLCQWTDVGHVTGPRGGTYKPVWHWNVTKRDDAAKLLERILPLMCRRRGGKIREVLAAYYAAAPTKGTAPTCSRGHELTEANTYLGDGRRRCRICRLRRTRESRERAKERLRRAKGMT